MAQSCKVFLKDREHSTTVEGVTSHVYGTDVLQLKKGADMIALFPLKELQGCIFQDEQEGS
jgi:hypothetical protein